MTLRTTEYKVNTLFFSHGENKPRFGIVLGLIVRSHISVCANMCEGCLAPTQDGLSTPGKTMSAKAGKKTKKHSES